MDSLSAKQLQAWVDAEPKKPLNLILKEKKLFCLSYLSENPLTTPESLIRFLSAIEDDLSQYRGDT